MLRSTLSLWRFSDYAVPRATTGRLLWSTPQKMQVQHNYGLRCYKHNAKPELDLLICAVLGFALPILTCLAMAVTVTVLVLWGNYKHKTSLGVDYSLLGQEGEVAVSDFVLAVALLTFLYIHVFFGEVFIRIQIPLTFFLIILYGVVEGVVWIGTIVEVCVQFIVMFRLCCSNSNNHVLFEQTLQKMLVRHDNGLSCYRYTAKPELDLLFCAVLGFALPILTCLAMAVTVLMLWGNYKHKN